MEAARALSDLLAAQAARQQRQRVHIERAYGSTGRDVAGLQQTDIVDPGDPLLPALYRLYRDIFTLAEEAEPLDGFRKVLALNDDRAVQQQFGPLTECITVWTDPANGAVVAATNQVFYACSPQQFAAYGYAASCQLNFICVAPAVRGLGIASALLATLADRLDEFAHLNHGTGTLQTFITCEQNDPLRMTPAEVDRDIRAALIDPGVRRAWWCRQGFRRLAFPYLQPPLAPLAAPCTYLDYTIRMAPPAAALPAPVLLDHLRRFFFVSVGKGEVAMTENAEWQQLAALLGSRATVAIDP